jgi:hypothetical protein
MPRHNRPPITSHDRALLQSYIITSVVPTADEKMWVNKTARNILDDAFDTIGKKKFDHPERVTLSVLATWCRDLFKLKLVNERETPLVHIARKVRNIEAFLRSLDYDPGTKYDEDDSR